ncbi:hypothetical protein [Actinoplanes derwentensis]|uniref:Uncharacterized protein n=1 Tax=Actinoplanes derwentensis TaxID=113562 RepID=A0A1H2D1S6_9ACTN|nr:hypothetical protein [Actinoplanes derwentensis]GID86825.1 hypothetical protein Ade03nite_57490 [Actinoplanes derwentensis]SDT76708.1 hypothetical protein SAMN04489716_7707 [Actinoplanes derwentensis]
MTDLETAPAEEVTRPEPWAGWGTVISVAGVILSIIATVLTAFLELALSSLRTGAFGAVLKGDSWVEGTGSALPLAALVAIGANLAIGWFAVTATGRRGAIGLPWALWTLIMLMAAGSRTVEGDYLLTETNWVSVVTILAGSLTFAVHAYKLILRPPADALQPRPSTDSGLPGSLQ